MNNDLMKIVEETKKLKTMVLEDDPETNELMCTTLKNFFSDVYSAYDGEAALDLYKKHQPDIIFVDIILPGKSGLAIAKEIREINPRQMIVVVSASDDMGNISEAVKIGVNNFIRKPINTDKMIDVLKDIVSDIIFNSFIVLLFLLSSFKITLNISSEWAVLQGIPATVTPISCNFSNICTIAYAGFSFILFIRYSVLSLMLEEMERITVSRCS